VSNSKVLIDVFSVIQAYGIGQVLTGDSYDRPIDSVQKLFDTAGIQSVLTPGSPSILTGYFSCSNPPTVGFGIPSTGNATAAAARNDPIISHKSKIFNILPSQLISNQTGDNCTSSITGTDEFPFWLIGQGTYLLEPALFPDDVAQKLA
jgi:hypothetical protein